MEVVITGANGGIGSSLCQAYSQAGYSVVAIDLHSECKHKFCETYIEMDANKFAVSEEYRKSLSTQLESQNPSVLINNCATQLLADFENFSSDYWHQTMNVNLSSAFFLIKAFYKNLVSNVGQVINIGSIHGDQTKPRFFAYATSKAALIGLTKSLALEFKGKITVNAVSPAAINTSMLREGFGNDETIIEKLAQIHPSKEIGEPKDLAQFILTLTQANNRFLNGANIRFDGAISSALLDLDI